MKTNLYLLGILTFIYSHVQSQSTIRDLAFGNEGTARCAFGANDSDLKKIAIQPDGKIIACGFFYLLQPGDIISDFAMSRFNSDGTIDSTFGSDGKVILPGGPYSEFNATDIKILNDGKILILGYTLTYAESSTNPETILLKYNADGSADMNFGNNGFLYVNPDLQSNAGYAMAIDADNKIVIGGSLNDGSTNFALFRLNADGSKDSLFGVNGVVNINLGTENDPTAISSDTIADIELLSNGGIIAGCSTKKYFPHNYDTLFSLVKVNSDGALDTEFGMNGRIFTNITSSYDEIKAIHILADESILAVGTNTSQSSFQRKIVLAKYNPDGLLDQSYGVGGTVVFTNDNSYPRFDALSSLINNDGQLVIGGIGNNPDTSGSLRKPMIMRFTADGNPDNSFAPNGVYFENEDIYPSDIILQPDGKLLLAGDKSNDSNIREFAIFRYENELLGTKSLSNGTGFSIYPNPFNTFLNIDFTQNEADQISIVVTDITGKKVTATKFAQVFPGKNSIVFEVPQNLQKGVYFLTMSGTKTIRTHKIIK